MVLYVHSWIVSRSKKEEKIIYHIYNQTSDKQRLEILETEIAIEKLWNLEKCVPAWA